MTYKCKTELWFYKILQRSKIQLSLGLLVSCPYQRPAQFLPFKGLHLSCAALYCSFPCSLVKIHDEFKVSDNNTYIKSREPNTCPFHFPLKHEKNPLLHNGDRLSGHLATPLESKVTTVLISFPSLLQNFSQACQVFPSLAKLAVTLGILDIIYRIKLKFYCVSFHFSSILYFSQVWGRFFLSQYWWHFDK